MANLKEVYVKLIEFERTVKEMEELEQLNASLDDLLIDTVLIRSEQEVSKWKPVFTEYAADPNATISNMGKATLGMLLVIERACERARRDMEKDSNRDEV